MLKEYVDKVQIFDLVYPVGSIYLSASTVTPDVLFGVGVWEKIEDSFLLTSGNKYSNGSKGGQEKVNYTPKGKNAEIKITAQQLPNRIVYSDRNLTGTPISSLSGMEWSTIPVGGDAYFASCTYDIANNKTLCGNTSMGMNSLNQTGHGHTFTGTTESITTMPPYLVINAWKRIE